MQKAACLILFLAVVRFCNGQDESGDGSLPMNSTYFEKVVKFYFRTSPYRQGFYTFVRDLMNDQGLTDRVIHKKTDTSMFSLQGYYKNFSPFSFLADRTEVKLIETPLPVNDSMPLHDTIYVYQLTGYINNTKTGLDEVKDEYERFGRRFGKHFSKETAPVKTGSQVTGEAESFYQGDYSVAPLTAAWLKLDEQHSAFSVVIRFKVTKN